MKSLKTQGEAHNRAKLSDAQVLEMMADYAERDMSRKDLALKYGIEVGHVSEILNGKSRTDNQAINDYRATIRIRDDRGQWRKKKQAVKQVTVKLHYSKFNND